MKPMELPRRDGAASYRRHVDRAETETRPKRGGVHLAFGSGRYRALVEEEVKQEKKSKKYKRVKKNVGKALRSTWKCLMLGLHHFALGYSTPVAAAAIFVPGRKPNLDAL
ncbi:uncharacterized protein LOC144064191 [Stigmatopora argus]